MYQWVKRSQAYDDYELQGSIKERTIIRERAKQSLIEKASDAALVLSDLMVGKMPEGDTTPIKNRHGEIVGSKASVSPSVRLQASIHTLALAGLVQVKRTEISGPNGEEIRVRARQEVSDLSVSKLKALLAVLKDE